jgi:hypothetical protein
LAFIFLYVGLIAIFPGGKFLSDFLSIGVYFAVYYTWCDVSRLLVEFLRVLVLLCVLSFLSCVVSGVDEINSPSP